MFINIYEGVSHIYSSTVGGAIVEIEVLTVPRTGHGLGNAIAGFRTNLSKAMEASI